MPAPSDDLTIVGVAGGAVVVPASELRWQFSRAGGAGGQHVNTSSSRVQLSWSVADTAALDATQRSRVLRRLAGQLVDGVLTITVSERRSQLQNRTVALERLATTIAGALAPPPPRRRATRPTRGSQERRVSEKKQRGDTKRLRGRPARDD